MFPIIGAHVIGMYALVIVIGDLIDRIGRTPVAGRRAARDGRLRDQPAVGRERRRPPPSPCSASASAGTSPSWRRPPSSPTCTLPSERGRLLGFNDLLSGATGAGLALLGGLALSALGVAALAIGGTVLVVGPALWILRHGMPEPGHAFAAAAVTKLSVAVPPRR